METLLFLAAAAAFAVFIGLAVVRSRSHARATTKQWAIPAKAFGLELRPAELTVRPRLTGTVDGLDVTVDVHYVATEANAKDRLHTRYQVRFEPLAFELEASAEKGPSGWLRELTSSDVPLGDPAFDERFVLRTDDPEAAAAVVTPKARERLLALSETSDEVFLRRDHLWLRTAGLNNNGRSIERTLRSAISVCQAVTTRA